MKNVTFNANFEKKKVTGYVGTNSLCEKCIFEDMPCGTFNLPECEPGEYYDICESSIEPFTSVEKPIKCSANTEQRIFRGCVSTAGACQLCCFKYIPCDLSCENGEYFAITEQVMPPCPVEEKTCNCQGKCTSENPIKSPYNHQVGGSHYKKKHDLAELLIGNDAGFAEGNISKYVLRHKSKNGFEDLQKAFHYLQMIAYSVYGKFLVDEDA